LKIKYRQNAVNKKNLYLVQNLPEQHATISRKISTFRNQKTPENTADLPLFVAVLLRWKDDPEIYLGDCFLPPKILLADLTPDLFNFCHRFMIPVYGHRRLLSGFQADQNHLSI